MVETQSSTNQSVLNSPLLSVRLPASDGDVEKVVDGGRETAGLLIDRVIELFLHLGVFHLTVHEHLAVCPYIGKRRHELWERGL